MLFFPLTGRAQEEEGAGRAGAKSQEIGKDGRARTPQESLQAQLRHHKERGTGEHALN